MRVRESVLGGGKSCRLSRTNEWKLRGETDQKGRGAPSKGLSAKERADHHFFLLLPLKGFEVRL